MPRVFLAGCPQGWCRQGFGWSLCWEAGCGASPGRQLARRERVRWHHRQLFKSWVRAGPVWPCLLPASTLAHPARVPFPQVPWLHMLYAAIGAIAFTLVS